MDHSKTKSNQSDLDDDDDAAKADRSTPLLRYCTRSREGDDRSSLSLPTSMSSPKRMLQEEEEEEQQSHQQHWTRRSWTAVQARKAVDRERLRSAPDATSWTSTSRHSQLTDNSTSKKWAENHLKRQRQRQQQRRYRFLTHRSRHKHTPWDTGCFSLLI